MDFKFCPHCGASLSGAPGADFCPACGGALGGGKKRGHPFLLAGLALLFGGALLAGFLWFFKALPTPLFAGDLPWLCFTAESADATVGLEAEGDAPEVTLETSTDGRTWNEWAKPRIAYLHQPGDKLYVRAKNANRSFANKNGDCNHFTISGKVAASGNLMSLVDKEGKRLSLEGMDFAFALLFKDCAGLTAAPRLPATKLTKGCYAGMFMNCAGLTQAPELPATELAEACYVKMFEGCVKLATAPTILPATKLAEGCYAGMFMNCAGLTSAPELPATELAAGCYAEMFENCKGLTTVPELPATTLAKDCYYLMFKNCAKLTTAPELPATTGREDSSIGTMFAGCAGLEATPPTIEATPRTPARPRRPVPTWRSSGRATMSASAQSLAVLRDRYGEYMDKVLRRIQQTIYIQQQIKPMMFNQGVVAMTFTIDSSGRLQAIRHVASAPEGLVQERAAARQVLEDVRNGEPLPRPTPEMLADPDFQKITINFIFAPL